MSKYNSCCVSIDGYTFDSIRESQRYSELKLMEKAGEIRELKVHPVIKLQPSFVYRGETIREINYEADFGYWENDVYEDVKGFETPVEIHRDFIDGYFDHPGRCRGHISHNHHSSQCREMGNLALLNENDPP
jgi:hypothetical protein